MLSKTLGKNAIQVSPTRSKSPKFMIFNPLKYSKNPKVAMIKALKKEGKKSKNTKYKNITQIIINPTSYTSLR